MTWLEFFSNAISSLAWPIAIVCLGLLFRSEIKQLASSLKLSRLKFGAVEAIFSDAVTHAEEELSSEKSGEPIDDVPPDEKMLRYLSFDTRFAVVAAWMDIEESLFDLAKHRGIFEDLQHKPWTQLLHGLELPSNIISAIHSLRRARNEAAHARGSEMSRAEVLRYLDVAADIKVYLRKLRDATPY